MGAQGGGGAGRQERKGVNEVPGTTRNVTWGGVRNRPPQDVPLWHVGCFEVTAIDSS